MKNDTALDSVAFKNVSVPQFLWNVFWAVFQIYCNFFYIDNQFNVVETFVYSCW